MTQLWIERLQGLPSDRSPLRRLPASTTGVARLVAGLALIVTAGLVSVGSAGADTLVDSGDVTVLLRQAESGDARAAFLLGMRYARPDDSGGDEVEAVRWLRKAAEQGLAEAQFNLGVMYASGRGVAPDPAQAAGWYRKAAEKGLASAQYNLGAQYAAGVGVSRDAQQAATWFERAALQDVPEAAYNLGVLYDLGRGVEADTGTAMQWYERAAEHGYHPAASRLAALRAANPELVPKSEMPSPTPQPAEKSSQAAAAIPPSEPVGTAPVRPPVTSAVEPVGAAAASVPSGDAKPRSASPWLARLDPGHYTLQVLSHTDEASVQRYLNANFSDGEAGYFAFEHEGSTWYSVVYGDYASYSQATAEAARLASRVRGPEPWVRKLAIIQKLAIR